MERVVRELEEIRRGARDPDTEPKSVMTYEVLGAIDETRKRFCCRFGGSNIVIEGTIGQERPQRVPPDLWAVIENQWQEDLPRPGHVRRVTVSESILRSL